MNVTQQTEVTVRIPRLEADMLAMALGEVLLAMGGCCKCAGPDAFPDGSHNWRTDDKPLRELYNLLRPQGWQQLLAMGRPIFENSLLGYHCPHDEQRPGRADCH